jgi:protein O-mannosyl-transferase
MSKPHRARRDRRPKPASGVASAAELSRIGRRRLWALAVAVAAVAVTLYLPGLGNTFTNWDDPSYVTENPHLGPFDAHFLAWAFTTFRQAGWNPLTWISLGVDHALFGLDPVGYHLTNVLLYGATTLAVVLLVGTLFARARNTVDGRVLVAALVAGLVFAVHPLHVESVAWVSERKDVLFGFFYVVALQFYLRFTERSRRGDYVASLGAFSLALLAKPTAVSLPLVLVILDAYPMGRFSKPGRLRVIVEKLPYFAIGLASTVVTIVAQWRGGAVARHIGLGEHLWISVRAFGFYLAKTVWPLNLVPMYPLDSQFSPWRWDYLLSLGIVLGASVAAILLRRRLPLFSALWAAFVAILLPAVAAILGEQSAADRHMYLPLVVPAIAIAAVAANMAQSSRRLRVAALSAGIVAVVTLAVLTVRQVGVWRDTRTLWTWVIETEPNVAMGHYNLGEYFREKGDLDRAGQCWRRAAELEPSFSWPLNQLGNLALLQGRLDEAHSYFERATRVNKNDAEAQLNFANLLEDQGQIEEARLHYEIFLRVAPPAKFAHLFPEVRAKLAAPAP